MASDIHFAMGGAIFGEFTAEAVQLISRYGLPGAEPYRGGLMAWLDQPQVLKDLLDENGIRLITASNGGPGQSTQFIDPSKQAETVADHVAFCRDFLKVFGCTHFKINMGPRPANGTTPDDIKAIAETVTEVGKRTLEMGVTIAPVDALALGRTVGRRAATLASLGLVGATNRTGLEGQEGFRARLSRFIFVTLFY